MMKTVFRPVSTAPFALGAAAALETLLMRTTLVSQ